MTRLAAVPEPTEAMVQAAFEYQQGLPSTGSVVAGGLKAAFAAAPPEWLLRVALDEEELGILTEESFNPPREICTDRERALLDKLSRALRGGEKP